MYKKMIDGIVVDCSNDEIEQIKLCEIEHQQFLVEFEKKQTIASIEADFNSFLAEKNIDSIGEASALLNSANVTWKSEAQRAIELWDLTWLAFYNNEPLPLLTWL
jgi:hypothetical protein